MRLEDLDVTGQQELFDRAQAAEARRMQREASTAFMAASQRPAPPRLTQVTRSSDRAAQVALAMAVISALGTDGYDTMAYSIGGAR